jgi:hypothetical protein
MLYTPEQQQSVAAALLRLAWRYIVTGMLVVAAVVRCFVAEATMTLHTVSVMLAAVVQQ